MSKLNVRNFADQIFGVSNKYLNEFIEPEIKKEEFTKNFKEGKLFYNNIKLKKRNELKLNSFLLLNFFEINDLNAIVPNENENLNLKLKNTKIYLKLLEINNKLIEKFLLENKIKKFENFVNFIINKILKKENKLSIIESLIQNILNKIFDGMKIFFENLEINFEYKNFLFKILIKNVNYDELNGIFIENLNFFVYFNKIENIFFNFNSKIEIYYKNNEIPNDNNKINVNIEQINLNFNKNIFLCLKNIFEYFNYFKYKKIECKFKKIIEYLKPKNLNKKEKFIYLKNLIKKLKDYNNNNNVFNISIEEEKNIINEYLNNNNNNENLIFVNKINLFSLSKSYIEKKIIEEKKKNIFNFFGGNKNELKEEEQNELNNIFNENIENYLKNNKNNNNNNNNFKEKIINFFKYIQIIININLINLQFQIENNNNIYFTLKKNYLNFIYHNNEINLEFKLNEILENNFSIVNKNNNNLNCIEFNIDKNKNKNIKFNFQTIILKESFIIQIIYYIFYFKKEFFYKVFKKTKEKKNNNNNFNFLNKINFSHIPNLIIIINNKEKITFDINNLITKNNEIQFNLKIQKNLNENFLNYNFIISKNFDNNNNIFYICNLNNPINFYINNILFDFLCNVYFIIDYAKKEKIIFFNENEENFYFNFNNNNKKIKNNFFFKN